MQAVTSCFHRVHIRTCVQLEFVSGLFWSYSDCMWIEMRFSFLWQHCRTYHLCITWGIRYTGWTWCFDNPHQSTKLRILTNFEFSFKIDKNERAIVQTKAKNLLKTDLCLAYSVFISWAGEFLQCLARNSQKLVKIAVFSTFWKIL